MRARPFLFLARWLVVASTAAASTPSEAAAPAPDASRAQSIVTARCVDCHATLPTHPGISSAPNGVVLEQLAQLKRHAERIAERLANGTMPPANVTGLTDEEKAELLAWAQAARKSGARR